MLPSTALFDHPTVEQLCAYVMASQVGAGWFAAWWVLVGSVGGCWSLVLWELAGKLFDVLNACWLHCCLVGAAFVSADWW